MSVQSERHWEAPLMTLVRGEGVKVKYLLPYKQMSQEKGIIVLIR